MDDAEINDRLWQIAGRFFHARRPEDILFAGDAPFDTTKGNLHDTKAEFAREKAEVEAAIERIEAVQIFLLSRYTDDSPIQNVSERVSSFLDEHSWKGRSRGQATKITDIVQRIAIDAGITRSALFIIFELHFGLKERKQQLDEQEVVYWQLSGRAPNHYARTIALRFARLIGRETGKRPTFGTSRDGNHPSTKFGRALEEVFELLGIEANVRNNARWAIDQLTEEDLNPVSLTPLFELAFGSGHDPSTPENPISAIVNALTKRSGK